MLISTIILWFLARALRVKHPTVNLFRFSEIHPLHRWTVNNPLMFFFFVPSFLSSSLFSLILPHFLHNPFSPPLLPFILLFIVFMHVHSLLLTYSLSLLSSATRSLFCCAVDSCVISQHTHTHTHTHTQLSDSHAELNETSPLTLTHHITPWKNQKSH